MKKLFIILAAVAALAVSCEKTGTEPSANKEVTTEETAYSFNFNIMGGGFSTEGVKGDATTGWTSGEKLFIFFQPEGEALLDKCLPLTWDGSKFVQGVVYIPYGRLGSKGKLSALYVPYFSGSPVYADGKWTVDGGDVYYSCASGVDYTVSDKAVTATINMAIPDGYVQFAVDAAIAGNNAVLSCNMFDAYSTVTLGSDLAFSSAAAADKKMKGHKDGDKVYFWGKKNASTSVDCEWTLTTAGGDLKKKVDDWVLAYIKAVNIDFPIALPGKFSVSADKQVYFSKGNLQATYHANLPYYSWGFAANQYEYIADGNTTIDTPTDGSKVDLFGWSSSEAKNYGVSASRSTSDYSGGSFRDWGTAIDNYGTWRTLAENEWTYLVDGRTDAADKKGCAVLTGPDARGLVLLPDEWSLPAGCTFNPSSGNSYDAAAWEKMEAAGAVFLPAAGYRDGSSVSDVNWKGYYRASTLFQSDDAGYLEFNYISSISTAAGFPTGDNLYFGMAVRLVSDCL